MWEYEYDWNNRGSRRPERFGCNWPVTEEGVLYDLLTGEMYVVEQIVPAALPDIPHPIMCTRSTGILAAELLSKLRKRNNYTPTDTNLPLDDVTFFKNDAQREEVLGL